MNNQDQINDISYKLDDIAKLLKIIPVTNELDSMLTDKIKNISESVNHIYYVLCSQQIDANEYNKIIQEDKQQRLLMQKLFPYYFHLSQTQTIPANL